MPAPFSGVRSPIISIPARLDTRRDTVPQILDNRGYFSDADFK